MKTFAFEFFTSTTSNIIISEFSFFFENSFSTISFIFTFFADFLLTFIIFLFFFSFSFSFICCSAVALNNWIVSIICSFAFVRRSRKRWFFQKKIVSLRTESDDWYQKYILYKWWLAVALHQRLKYIIYLKRRHCFISLTAFFRRRSARIKTWKMPRSKERT